MTQNLTTNNNAQGKLILSASPEAYNDDIRMLFFNSVTDDSLSFNSDITDNWLENNTAIQDHITLAPISITMRGLIGEVVYTPADAEQDYQKMLPYLGGNEIIDFTLGKLNTVVSYFPSVSNATQKAMNKVNLQISTFEKAAALASVYFKKPGLNSFSDKLNDFTGLNSNLRQEKQKKIIELLKQYWLNRMSFKAVTPWGDYENMFIQSVNISQSNINYASEISITLKQIRYASTIYTKADEEVLAKYSRVAQAKEENYGKAGSQNSMAYDSLTPNSEYKNNGN